MVFCTIVWEPLPTDFYNQDCYPLPPGALIKEFGFETDSGNALRTFDVEIAD